MGVDRSFRIGAGKNLSIVPTPRRLCKESESDGGSKLGQAVPDGISVCHYDETTAYGMAIVSIRPTHALSKSAFAS